jgi:hypothetical protein
MAARLARDSGMDREQQYWHRLFGIALMDFFSNSPFRVELEKDLSLSKQLLDVVILRGEASSFAEPLPDGLDDLAMYNLITFKPSDKALDDWALKELTGHYVNYRKQVGPSMQRHHLRPEEEFRLYAVCGRFPHNLAGQLAVQKAWVRLRPGVYECRRGTDTIRVLVLVELPQTENNALLLLFSASPEQRRYGAEHYRQHSEETSTLLQRLLEQYRKEGVPMPYTLEDFRRDYVKEHLKDLTTEERLAGLSAEQRIEGLPPEQLLAALSPETMEALRKQLQGEASPPASE